MCEVEWSNKSLFEVSSNIKDGTHGTFERTLHGVPFLSAKNVGEGKIRWDVSDDRISEFDFKAITNVFAPRRNDLLLTIVGTLGRTALFNGDKVAFQRSVAFVRPNASIRPRFLYHAASTP